MMMKSHIIISKSLLENTDANKQFFLDSKNFIYGNIKPDIVSKYKLKKQKHNKATSPQINHLKTIKRYD